MAEKKAKTAEKGGAQQQKKLCPQCGAEARVVKFVGFGPRGFFWVCDKNCGYQQRTR
jgi:ssDNA-binding Zn-finger/Zn-ribbon topoisomerase 1